MDERTNTTPVRPIAPKPAAGHRAGSAFTARHGAEWHPAAGHARAGNPVLRTAWAVHPCAIPDPDNQPGPWLQFRVPLGFEWNRIQVPVPALPPALEGLRIVHVSDFHLRPFWSDVYDEVLDRIAADPPDLLVATGDFVENKRDHRPALPMVLRLVEGFRAKLGCYGVLGNHDRYGMAAPLEGTNLTLLDDKREVVARDGAKIELIGLPGVDRKDLNDTFLRALPRREQGVLRIVLSHFPDHLRRTASLKPDLFLAGHTHGGQVCLPGGLPIIKHDALPRRLCTGIHRVENTWLVVNRGFGFSGPQIRLFCPAEVMELQLTRAASM